ncbi:oligogalacturonate lyase family protein [Paenibacillus agricola]|uniref:Oligogalacturonide lyase n=1 Tax=Paenibacillus agricola TaxID=2716264 RepID=A0ABX0JHD5_9BACL|nr:oligogalacturonate lyase family protein [Paenibacillus agricola]NHN33744.1 oligogalacturonide lyase [Paenibacillus agricola]
MIWGKGKVWPSEQERYEDPKTGVAVCQLTNYKGHSRHLYFTENGWFDGGSRVLFVSDRQNCTNLFSLELSTGEITQLTDLGGEHTDLSVCLNPLGTHAYYRMGQTITSIDLSTLAEEVIFQGMEDFQLGQVTCMADGAYLAVALSEDYSKRLRLDLTNGYVGHRELMEAKPLSRIARISTRPGGGWEILHEEHAWIGHLNASPTQPNLLTFCHEGPWHLVDQRIWGMDLSTGTIWKIRERKEPLELIGHEYWHEDGVHVGYHGFKADRSAGFFGKVRYDNTELEEVGFEFVNWHAHSYGFEQVVVDGRFPLTDLIYWKRVNGVFNSPRVLCEHRCSFHSQLVHAHPRFSPDGRQLLFTSDRNGYANLYLLDLPEDPETLPLFEG